jgi:hypothetical protein
MDSVDQKRREVFAFLAAHGVLLAAQGSVQESYRLYKGRKLGPFFRLSFREAGQQRSLYIGRDQALAAEIKAQMQKLRAPRAHARQLERCLADCRGSLKVAKLEFRRRLEAEGLRLQGNEIRGWRTQRHLASVPPTWPARQGPVMGQERGASAQPPLPQPPRVSCRYFPPVAIRPSQNTLPERPDHLEYPPQELVPGQPKWWAKNHVALSKRIPDHAIY